MLFIYADVNVFLKKDITTLITLYVSNCVMSSPPSQNF